jgi:hypothetical protein
MFIHIKVMHAYMDICSAVCNVVSVFWQGHLVFK